MATPAEFPADYQLLFRRQPDALLLLLPDGTIVDNTDAHEAAGLKPREQVVGRHIFEAYPVADQNQSDEIERSHAHVRQHLEAHTMPLIRYDLAGPDGQLRVLYWQASHYPVLDAAGQLRYILQRTQDVTEQVHQAGETARARAALAEEQERTHFVLENLPVLIWTSDAQGRPDYLNARWEAYTGLGRAQGRHWEDAGLVHPDDQPRVQQEMDALVARGEEYQQEFRLRRHDGQYRWVLCRNVPRRNAQGEVMMWVGGGVDVHDQKELVREVLAQSEQQAALVQQAHQADEQLRQERTALREVFEHLPAGIAIMRGPEHRYEYVNPAYHGLRPQDPMLGRTVAEVFPEAAEQGFVDLLDQVYRTGEPVSGQRVLWQYDRRGTGQREDTYFTFTYQPLREHGVIVGIHCFALDVTDY